MKVLIVSDWCEPPRVFPVDKRTEALQDLARRAAKSAGYAGHEH